MTEATPLNHAQEADPTTEESFGHISTAPPTRQDGCLRLRSNARALGMAAIDQRKPKVALMVHGGFGPSSWPMTSSTETTVYGAAARAGFDVHMSHTGYGPLPRPLMDDPCNVDADSSRPRPICAYGLALPDKLVCRTEWMS
jgi:hypothetical protein